ncbi:putative ferric-chelate reductase 1 [Pomacea canaliculata]|uniref:putative ferric-chelate reductase 1 n=1 Tax=Pomacea canaliculata TaxID=400727 RepID=UPI000D72A41A|nr:putative ferric-chelate reductase 1 [Pomacea canaliculata]XP_025111277.1 putative ferric-chelate reductase 1 [Pomacea canaliculata]
MNILKKKWLVLSMLVCVYLAEIGHCYSGGAPEVACSSLIPGHGVGAQTSPSPYILQVDPEFTPGKKITVTIAGRTEGTAFKGFMVTAYSQGFTVGSIAITDAENSQTRCNGLTVSHKGASPRTKVSFDWVAPNDIEAGTEVSFTGTVVKDRETFWTKITSNITKATATTASATNVASNVANNVPPKNDPSLLGSGGGPSGFLPADPKCGVSKACLHRCTKNKCEFIVSWKDMGNTLSMEMAFRLPGSQEYWIAVGFSRDQKMGDDSVTECIMRDSRVEVYQSFNDGDNNNYLDNKRAGLSEVKGNVEDGVLYCSFLRAKTYPHDPRVFDLNEDYYLFVATGEAFSGNKLPHAHDVSPLTSERKIDLQILENLAGGQVPSSVLVKIHAILMIISWLLLTSFGVMTAKYGKPLWPKFSPCGTNIWFHIHRTTMFLTVILSVAGLVVIFVDSEGYSRIPHVVGKAYWPIHPPLGLLVMVLTIINPVMALFRPSPENANRYIFNWSHWGVGVMAWFLASIEVFIGLDLEKAHAPNESIYILLAWGVYHIIVVVVLEVLPRPLAQCYTTLAENTTRKGRSYNLERVRTADGTYADNGANEQAKPPADSAETKIPVGSSKQPTGDELKVRRVILVFHYGVVTIFTLIILLVTFLYMPPMPEAA